MNTLQKSGGFAGLYMAVAHLVGIVVFLVVLDYLNITDPAQKVALNVNHKLVVFSTNLLMYVFFGFALLVLSLALYDRLKSGAPALMQVATAVAIIWAGSLIASGMVANAGLAAVTPIYANDPAQAAALWQSVETVTKNLATKGRGWPEAMLHTCLPRSILPDLSGRPAQWSLNKVDGDRAAASQHAS